MAVGPEDKTNESQAAGYIHIKNWEKRQHHKYESPPWHKVYNNTLRDDDYLRLSHSDRGLLHDLWTLASLTGDGRVSADRTFLARQLNVRRVSLEPLIEAGFIEVLGTKRVRIESESVLQSREEKNPLTPASGGTVIGLRGSGTSPREIAEREARALKRAGAVEACRRVWQRAIDDGENLDALRESLKRDYNHDPTILDEATRDGAAA